MLLHRGSRRYFTKVIRALQPKPHRKSTFINLDRIRCSVVEVSNYTPSNETIWKSVRSVTLRRLTREFFWKCIHNTFRVGDFWSHISTYEIRGHCNLCGNPETLEHIALERDTPEQKLLWNLTRQLWERKYAPMPSLSWGLILGCNLVRFFSVSGMAPDMEPPCHPCN
ncbi:hypothetical protein C8J57DRAFT_1135196 [Mycena rebaudengoi]|nr:hypothetical protein C8J57DRAFT_1135196 [Mycena rebaudengoi]